MDNLCLPNVAKQKAIFEARRCHPTDVLFYDKGDDIRGRIV